MHTQVYTGFEAAHLDFFPILLYHGVICGELHLFAVGRPLHALISYIVNMLHERSFFSCVDFQLVSVTCGFSLPRPDTYLVIEGFVTHTKWSMKCCHRSMTCLSHVHHFQLLIFLQFTLLYFTYNLPLAGEALDFLMADGQIHAGVHGLGSLAPGLPLFVSHLAHSV
jgi:hypothetical protein